MHDNAVNSVLYNLLVHMLSRGQIRPPDLQMKGMLMPKLAVHTLFRDCQARSGRRR